MDPVERWPVGLCRAIVFPRVELTLWAVRRLDLGSGHVTVTTSFRSYVAWRRPSNGSKGMHGRTDTDLGLVLLPG